MLSKLQSVHLCCLVLTIATPYLLVFLSILLRGFKESKMRQPDQYLEHPDLSTSHHSSRTITGTCQQENPTQGCCTIHTSLSGSGPQYFSDLTHVYTPSRSLRFSSDTRILSTPNVKLKSYGQRSFAYHGPCTWNSLPLALRYQQKSDCFKRALKTHLFSLN